MEAPAAPTTTLAWRCPECGHGSPEPRDRPAHLDAHRQLKAFFREWDDAVASDARVAAPATAPRRMWRIWGAAALAVVCVALLLRLLLAGHAGHAGQGGRSGPAPVPGVDLPGYDLGPVAAEPTGPTAGVVGAPASAPPPAPAGIPAARASSRPASALPAPVRDAHPAQSGGPDAPAGAGVGAQPSPGAPPAAAPQRPLVHACVLGLCIAVP